MSSTHDLLPSFWKNRRTAAKSRLDPFWAMAYLPASFDTPSGKATWHDSRFVAKTFCRVPNNGTHRVAEWWSLHPERQRKLTSLRAARRRSGMEAGAAQGNDRLATYGTARKDA